MRLVHDSALLRNADKWQDEELRQDGMNRILRDRLGSSVLVPFPPDNVEEPAVLDCGFGKASWIDDFLSDYDQCVVM